MYKHHKMRLISALLLTVSLSACAIGSDYKKPETALPEQWPWAQDVNAQANQVISKDWWNQFNDPALTALIEEGLQANADLLVAAARVSQARAMLTNSQSELYPTLDAQAGAVRVKNSAESASGAVSSKPFNDLSLGAVLNYELDIWGRIRRSNESAREQLLASQAARDAVHLAVASNIALGYFNLRALDMQLDITEHTIESRQDALEFQRKQYDMGGENALAFHQAEAELAVANAQKPALEQLRAEQESALAVLLGRSPREIVQGKVNVGHEIDNVTIAPALPNNLPSYLLERRPDIAAAEHGLIAANANIAVAKADYFPRLSLSGLLGLASNDADDLLRSSARKWQFGANAAMPIIDFGRTSSRVDAAEAAKEEALVNYQQTVRVAFKEVMDAMSAENTSQAREKAQMQQMKSRAETLRLSDLRYKSGYSNYLEVLDAQRYLYQAQMDRVAARRDRLSALVNLYRALGGGWGDRKNDNHTVIMQQEMTQHSTEDVATMQLEQVETDTKMSVAAETSEGTVDTATEEVLTPREDISKAVSEQAEIVSKPEPASTPAPAAEPVPEPVMQTPMPQSTPVQQPMQLPAEMM